MLSALCFPTCLLNCKINSIFLNFEANCFVRAVIPVSFLRSLVVVHLKNFGCIESSELTLARQRIKIMESIATTILFGQDQRFESV